MLIWSFAMRNDEITKILKDFFNANTYEDAKPFLDLIGKLINSKNKMAFKIRSILFELGYKKVDEELVFEVAAIIVSKKETLLKAIEKNGINSNYLYTIVFSALMDMLDEKIKKNKEISIDGAPQGENEEDNLNLSNVLSDDDALKELVDIFVEETANFYLNYLKNNLEKKHKEALCYYFSKDKDINRDLFLSDLGTNTKDKRVQRAKESLGNLISKIYSSEDDYNKEADVWLRVFEKFWSDICLNMVNKGVSNNSEETK